MRTVRKATSEQWHKSELDEDVRYLICPPGNRISSHAATKNSELGPVGSPPDFWGGDYTFDMVGFALKDIEGILNEDGTPFKLEFKNRKIGKKTEEKRVTDECIVKLPTDIYHEIEKFIIKSTGLTKAEKDNMDFTTDSPTPQTSSDAPTATETSRNAAGFTAQEIGECVEKIQKEAAWEAERIMNKLSESESEESTTAQSTDVPGN